MASHNVPPAQPGSVQQQPARGGSGRGTVLGILLALIALAAAGGFIWKWYLPLRQERAALAAKLDDQKEQLTEVARELKANESAKAELQAERDRLAAQHAEALKAKEAALAELERPKSDLSSKLEVEVESGDIAIKRRGRHLVVDVADKILFDTGEAEVNDRGREVLEHVGTTLRKFRDHLIQVGGHTDSARIVTPELRERYPTNWELSAARATNVVRYLQEKAGIPGKRLVAQGFAQFRPAASNRSKAGRKKNRRIEVVLVPKPKSEKAP